MANVKFFLCGFRNLYDQYITLSVLTWKSHHVESTMELPNMKQKNYNGYTVYVEFKFETKLESLLTKICSCIKRNWNLIDFQIILVIVVSTSSSFMNYFQFQYSTLTVWCTYNCSHGNAYCLIQIQIQKLVWMIHLGTFNQTVEFSFLPRSKNLTLPKWYMNSKPWKCSVFIISFVFFWNKTSAMLQNIGVRLYFENLYV